MRILLSRTDSIGDVVLTLPMTGLILRHFPDAKIDFLASRYTLEVVSCCAHIHERIDWDELKSMSENLAIKYLVTRSYDAIIHVFPDRKISRLAKLAGIKNRIGTTGRMYHWIYCNKLVRFTRRRSNKHEAQLNMKLLKPLSIPGEVSLGELHSLMGFQNIPSPKENISSLIDREKFNVILHPKSKGSAVEWGLENFSKLITLLSDKKYRIFISGTENDRIAIGENLPFSSENVVSILGKFSLHDYIKFVAQCDAIVAASTGPLHIAAALGIKAVGLYSSRRPIHPGRWAPVGPKSIALVYDENCVKCKSGESCNCIQQITPETVLQHLSR